MKKEYDNILKASDMAKIMVSENKSVDDSSVPQIMLCLYNSFNNYSVVAYDAKFHVDLFNQGIPSLKNRKVLTIMGYGKKYGSRSCDENPNEFNFTLLDWGKEIRFRWKYIREHGVVPDNNRITQKTLDGFFLINPYQKKSYEEASDNFLEE